MEAWKKKSVQNIKDMSKKKGKKTPKETTILAHKKTIGAFNDKDKEYEEILARARKMESEAIGSKLNAREKVSSIAMIRD